MKLQHLVISAIIAGATTVSVQVHAQNDSTRLESQQPTEIDPTNYSKILPSKVPSPLRNTLKSSMYKGWEGGKIYQHNNGDGFWVSIGSGSEINNYYFDKNGEPAKSPARVRTPD